MKTADFAAAAARCRASATLPGQQAWAEAVTAVAVAEGLAPATKIVTDETDPGWLHLDLAHLGAEGWLRAARRPPCAADGEQKDRTRLYCHRARFSGALERVVFQAGRVL